jgi:hypothetical protein
VAVAEESVAGPVAVAVAVPVAVSGFSCIVGVPVQAFGGGQPNLTPKALRNRPQEHCLAVTKVIVAFQGGIGDSLILASNYKDLEG